MGISQVHNCVFGCSVKYNELKEEYDTLKPKYNECYIDNESYKQALKTLERQKVWFQKNQLKYDEKISVLESDLEIAKIDLKRTEKEKADVVNENLVLKQKLDEEIAKHKQWLISGDNLASVLYGSQAVNSGIGLGFKKYVGLEARNDLGKTTSAGLANYVKEGKLHAVPGPIRGEHMPTDLSISVDFYGSHHLYGKKSSDLPDPTSQINDFVSCSDSDKSSDQGSTSYASCDSSDKSDLPKIIPKTIPKTSPKTPYKPIRVTAPLKTVPSEDLLFHSLQNNSFSSVKNNFVYGCDLNNFSCYGTSFNMNKSSKKKKCFVYGSKFHLIKDCTYHEQRMGDCQRKPRPMWNNVNNIPSFVPHQQKHNSADKHSWRRTVDRQYSQPTSSYFYNDYWPRHVDFMRVNKGNWDTAGKSSAGCSWTKKGPKFQYRPKNNSGSYQSAWPTCNDPQGRLKSEMA